MGWFRKIIALFERNLTWVQLVTGGSLMTIGGWVSKVIAERTDWVLALGPFGIWSATVGGALAAIIALWGVASFRRAWIQGSALNRWKNQTHGLIDPMQRQFDRKRILVTDLVSPINNRVSEKTFEECELVGPANIVFLGTGGALLAGNNFTKADAVSVAAAAVPQTTIEFLNCRFVRCHFYNVTLFLHEGVFNAANQAINGLNWITNTPANADFIDHQGEAPARPSQIGTEA